MIFFKWLLASTLAMTAASFAQQRRAFEVVSIKRTPPGTDDSAFRLLPGASVRITNTTVRELILMAYDLRDFQLSGGPPWMSSERFDIQAKPDRAEGPADFSKVTEELAQSVEEHTRERLRAMLADRFRLSLRREEKEGPVLALALARERHYLRPSAPAESPRQHMRSGYGQLHATHVTMATLASALSTELGRPVRDETGLSGHFDFDLQWTPDPAADLPGAAPPLPTALRDQLGLRLDSKRGPIEHYVVEAAERPSEN